MHSHLHSHSTLLCMLALKKNNYDAIVDTKVAHSNAKNQECCLCAVISASTSQKIEPLTRMRLDTAAYQ